MKDRDLALKTLFEHTKLELMDSPYNVSKPRTPSDIIWENKFSSRRRLITEAISMGALFFVCFSAFVIGIYFVRKN